MITLTENAKDYLTDMVSKSEDTYARLSVKGGGCAGFSYKWDYIDEPDKGHTIFHIKDEVSLAVDKVAEMYIMGSEIDYVQEIMGSFLKINNPLTKSSCGCGESFSV